MEKRGLQDRVHNGETVLERSLAELRQVVEKALVDVPSSVYLYGSVVNGARRRSSDIDIAVWTESDPPAGRMAALRERIEESRVPYSVDVVLLNEADPEFAGLVMREGVRWIG